MQTTERTNIEKANELQGLANQWVDREFNYIQLEVVEKMLENMLFEHIRPEDPDYLEFIDNYALHSEFKDETGQEAEKADEQTLQEFCEQETSFDDWRFEREGENYPMWNTLFEFRYEPSEEVLEAAQAAGFGIIEPTEYFNTMLFVAGAGYSFYGAHWIPLYLNLPYNEDKKEQFKGVDYSMV